jgi:hypothetical protein
VPRGARRRDVDFAAGVAQGILHSLHDDQQRRVGVALRERHQVHHFPHMCMILPLHASHAPSGGSCMDGSWQPSTKFLVTKPKKLGTRVM